MRLLYGVTTQAMVTLAETYHGSIYKLYLADSISASSNPMSSDPLSLFREFSDIVHKGDAKSAKFIYHIRGLRRGTKSRLKDDPRLGDALKVINGMGTNAVRPYLAILEADTYETNHGITIEPLSPPKSIPLTTEYLVADVHGPKAVDPELHVERLF
jgi:hypothetical protein